MCLNTDCMRNNKGKMLRKSEQRQAVLFTLDQGVLPAWSVHLYCEGSYNSIICLMSTNNVLFAQGCKVNYHHNYRMEGTNRIYYDSLPSTIQVGEHQFVERRVIEMWITLMLISW